MRREHLAHKYFVQKQYMKALEVYSSIIESEDVTIDAETQARLLFNKALCYQQLGNHGAVIKAAEGVLALDLKDKLTSRARAKVVVSYFLIGHASFAEKILDAWLGNSPQDSHALRTQEKIRSLGSLKPVEEEPEMVLAEEGRRSSPEGRESGRSSPSGRSGTGGVAPDFRSSRCAPGTAASGPRPYCDLCDETFDGEEGLRAHCSTGKHRDALVSDDGRDWRFRPPPRGVPAERFVLCESHASSGECRLGRACCEAHGEDELAEWEERFRYRLRRVDRARERRLVEGYVQYAEDLLRRFGEAVDPGSVITENMKGLHLVCRQDLELTLQSKSTEHEWHFKLKTKTPLQRLVLLEDNFRHNFCLKKVTVGPFEFVSEADDRQEWVNNLRCLGDGEEPIVYFIKVAFRASMYATFRQTLALDFGGQPVLARRLSVDLVAPGVLEELQKKRRAVVSREGRWSAAAADVVPCDEEYRHRGGAEAAALEARYAAPDPNSFRVTQGLVLERLTKNNYAARMHELLYVEELTRADIVGQYNILALLDLTNQMQTSSRGATQTCYAQGGELYASLALEADVTGDTPAGRLVLDACQRAWISPVANPSRAADGRRRVYEVSVEHVKKKKIYLKLSKTCVQELRLKPQTELNVEIQFHLNRLPLCEMHYAVDKLSPTTLVFPDFSVEPDLPADDDERCDVAEPASALNVHQRRAVACIAAPGIRADVPPVLVVGPFGTGKTFTLANALLRVLEQPDTRVLVCTHSNSAADLYVLNYLDAHVREHPEARPLRVMYEYRVPNTVDRRLRPYCIETPAERRTPEGPWFRRPTLEEVERYRVVVTTLSSSRMLLASGIQKGFFTHIMIDEAAQALEAECILPLALADRHTRLVFAGDYMQLNPDVYSVVARECKFHVSLLERLHDLYPNSHPCKVLLRDNYRSHETLVRYTSESFYGNRLRASGPRVRHGRFHPLTFFAAQGCDVVDGDGTSFYNGAEVREIRDRIREVVDGWPEEWGELDHGKIAVVTPYYEQVARIRAELRGAHLSAVKVETVANVQGKEFRVVILSTVRTRATCLHVESRAPVKEALDFGFLSNSKLLNTAVTRAQSLVAVVGDPVALCSVGACRKLWEKFIKMCRQAGSLFNMTWEDIAYQLNGIELKREYGLNPHAPSFAPSGRDPSPVRPHPSPIHDGRISSPPSEPPRPATSSVDGQLLDGILRSLRNVPPPNFSAAWPSAAPADLQWYWPWQYYWQRQRATASAPRVGPNVPWARYDRPQPGHERPQPGHERPQPGHERPQPGHERPQPGHERPQPGHGRPQSAPNWQQCAGTQGRAGYERPKANVSDYRGYPSHRGPSNPGQERLRRPQREQQGTRDGVSASAAPRTSAVLDGEEPGPRPRAKLPADLSDMPPGPADAPRDAGDDYLSRMLSGASAGRTPTRAASLEPPGVRARANGTRNGPSRGGQARRSGPPCRDGPTERRRRTPRETARRDGPPPGNVARGAASTERIEPTVAYVSNVHGPIRWHAETDESASSARPATTAVSYATDVRQLYEEATRDDTGRRDGGLAERLREEFRATASASRTTSYADAVRSTGTYASTGPPGGSRR